MPWNFTTSPKGEPPKGKSFFLRLWPSTETLRALSRSVARKARPSSTIQFLAAKVSGITPVIPMSGLVVAKREAASADDSHVSALTLWAIVACSRNCITFWSVRFFRRRYFRSEEHTSELQSQSNLVCRLLLEKKKKTQHDDLECSAVRRQYERQSN